MIALLTAVMAVTAFSQETLLVANGSSSGTYEQFLKEIEAAIPDSGIVFKRVPSSGAIENLDKLINNEVSAAFLHSDVIYFRSKAEAGLDQRYKTLLPLFNEDVHFLTLTESKRKTGGTFGYGAKPVVFRDVSDLAGYKVGAAGGGYVTSQVIRLQGEINYQVVQFNSGKELLEALNAGTVDAVEFTGAAPLTILKDLGPQYRLLPIPSQTIDKLKAVYKPSNVTYNKMSPNGVPTVAAQCLFVAKVYKTPRMVNQLATFRNAFYAHLDELKETPGNHKKWQDVSVDDHGPWPYLELPTNSIAGSASR